MILERVKSFDDQKNSSSKHFVPVPQVINSPELHHEFEDQKTLWRHFVTILTRIRTKRQCLSQRDGIKRTGYETEHRRYYSKVPLKMSEVDDAERKGDLQVMVDGHVDLKSELK